MIEPCRLNFGSGSIQPASWTNVDRDPAFAAEPRRGVVHADILDGLPFADDTFDYIVANHSLQQIAWPDLPRAVAELYRVLQPGGTLRVVVPDIDQAYGALSAEDWDWFPNREDTLDATFTAYVTWYGTNLTAFTAISLRDVLGATFGFHVDRVAPHESRTAHVGITDLDDRDGESIFMEATKVDAA